MRKTILFLLFLYPIMFYGQEDSGSIVGSIGGNISVSVLGGAIYSIPLEIPKGVNNMQPELAIVYNNQGGNNLLGYGWNINGISTITRTGSTLYHDGKMSGADLSDDDRFLLDGQRLILVGSSGNNYEYKTENDEFSKIIFQKVNGFFSKCEVRLENGNIIKYGYTTDSKLMASDGNNVIKWMVSSIEDRNGNTVSYVYETNGTDSDLFIKDILYTSNSQVGLNSQFKVSFTYSNNRFDHYHYYIAGNKVLCSRILTSIDVLKGNETIISYGFTYDGSIYRMYNLLTEISLSKGNYALRPTVITWNTDDNDIQNNTLNSHAISQSILDEFSCVGDFNGDGYSDLLTVPYKPYQSTPSAKVYLNNMHGVFSTTPDFVMAVPDSLEWLHVLDMNGDGYDDIVLQTMTYSVSGNNGQNYNYRTYFTVLESQQGSGFINAYSDSIYSKALVKVGDFLGEGKCGLLVLELSGYNNDPDFDLINGTPFIIHHNNTTYCRNNFNTSLFNRGIVLSDDFNGDGRTELMLLDGSYMFKYHFNKQNSVYSITEQYEPFSIYGTSFFTGDFNGDGKADMIFSYGAGSNYIILSTGDGFTDPISIESSGGNGFGQIVFPSTSMYNFSLENVDPNLSYGVNFSDIDGDGKTDVIYYNGHNHIIFFRDFQITGTDLGRFNIKFDAESDEIYFKNQFFTLGNFLGKDNMSFVAIDPQNLAQTDDDIVKIFSLPSVNQRFSVSSITDGWGKRTDIEYDYLMPGQTDFYSFANRQYVNDVKPCPMPLIAMKSYTEFVGQNSYKTRYKYANALIHKTGRGFVNFENVEKTSYINNSPVKQDKSFYETTTMGANALALPLCDSTFLYNSGNKILSETNTYSFQNASCSRQATTAGLRLIVRPAMVAKQTKKFNPDSKGQLLSFGLEEYTYNCQSNNTYSDTYRCTSIKTGANPTACNSVSDCGYSIITQITYNSDNYTNWIINRKSQETSITKFQTKPAITRKTSYTYTDNNSYLVSTRTDIPSASSSNPLTVRHSFQYDGCGNLITETTSAPYGTYNEAPLATSYTYSDYRLMASKTSDPNGLSYQEQYTYDSYDRVTSHTGSNGLATTYIYNNTFGTNVKTIEPTGVYSTEQILWTTPDNWTPTGALYYKSVQPSNGPLQQTFYDASGNILRTLTAHTGSGPDAVDIRYNERGVPTQQSNTYNFDDSPQWTTFQYDGLGRLTSTTAPDGTVVGNTYNGLTTSTTTTSGNSSRTSTQTTNYLGWVTSCTDANQATVAYTYYSDGKVETMVTSNGNVSVRMTYDNAGNRTALNDSDYGVTTSLYDAYGRLIRQITPKNDRFDYVYDVLGRITQKTSLSDTTTTLYQYNENTHKGTLASVTHNGQSLQYAYDSYDRVTAVTETRGSNTYTTSYEYTTSSSRVKSKTYPSGYKVNYTYNSDGSIKFIKDIYGNNLWKTDKTNACRQLVRATTGNGAVTTNTYDALTNRLTGSATSNGIQNFAYTFDGFGNLTSRTDSIGTIKTETFTYDNLDRLTGITLGNVTSSMVYDSYGRITSKQKEGSTVFSAAQYSSSKPHAIRNVSTTSTEFPSSQVIEYNSLDKVKRLAQSKYIVTFTYGYDGQRTRMTVTDTLTGRIKTKDYVGNCEFVNDNGITKTYTYLSSTYGVFAMVISSGGTNAVHYVYKDHLGSWTTVTDSTGTVVERKSFDAWGNLRNASTWTGNIGRLPKFDRGFTGHEHLYELGLINMNGRMYDPLLSSFLSPDNYMQDPTSQQGFNRYAYCMYNPLKYVDPTGEQYFGWDPGMMNRIEQEAKRIVWQCWQVVYDDISMSHAMTVALANSLYSQGDNRMGKGGSGNHGSGGGGNSQSEPTGNSHGDGDDQQHTPSWSLLNGLPGSSEDNLTSATDLQKKVFWWYNFGNKNDFFVDAATINFDYLSLGELNDNKDGTYSINLFQAKYISKDPEMAAVLGEITLIPQGDDMYEIVHNKYDFDIRFEDGWSKRNIATVIGGFLFYGNINNKHYIPSPAMFLGGPFEIHFKNYVHIKRK